MIDIVDRFRFSVVHCIVVAVQQKLAFVANTVKSETVLAKRLILAMRSK
ncbi:MAG TPA: hypothetical protein VER36_12580 [Flavisolibacter sp.]|nr:hypothetical protein [Flavisolibacter sp.]